MRRKNTITDAEWPIMQVLWENETATAAEIIKVVTRQRSVSDRTLKTLIRRLIDKGVVAFTVDTNDSRIYHYRALISKDASINEKNQAILDTIYGGNAGELLVNFVQNAKLSEVEISTLRALLEAKQDKRDGK